MTEDWTVRLAGARMQVDKQFEPTVADSEFTSQEWGLIMTAVEFDIEAPQDPEAATLVARGDKLPDIVPELDRIQDQMGGSPTPVEEGHGSGISGRLRQFASSLSLDLGSTDHGERIAAAKVLTQEYADELQSFLESEGRWAEICEAAAAERAEEPGEG